LLCRACGRHWVIECEQSPTLVAGVERQWRRGAVSQHQLCWLTEDSVSVDFNYYLEYSYDGFLVLDFFLLGICG
jgi:hypothetical protein